jgi:hypothetical protein
MRRLSGDGGVGKGLGTNVYACFGVGIQADSCCCHRYCCVIPHIVFVLACEATAELLKVVVGHKNRGAELDYGEGCGILCVHAVVLSGIRCQGGRSMRHLVWWSGKDLH